MCKRLIYLTSFVLALVAVPLVTNAQVGNLVQNPSFEEDEAILDDPNLEAWATWNAAGGAGSNATIVDTEFVDGTRSLRIEPIGGVDWFFIVMNLPLPLEVGTQYTSSFWAKAEAPRPLNSQMKATDNSVSWGWTSFQLTTEWAEYTFTSEALNAEGKLEFSCASVEVPFWLDLVSVAVPEPNEPAPIVLNGDFELPDGGKINTDWDLIPGWSSDTPPADSGLDVEETYPGYGYSAFLMDGDPNVWQTTAHIIAAGDRFTLSLVASDNYTDLVGDWSVEGGGQLTVSLYYDDGVTRTTVATTDIEPAASYPEMDGPFRLAFNAADVPASTGYAIGIEIMNSSPTAVPNHSWVFFDDVQLTVAPPIVINGDFELPDEGKINTDWGLIPGWSSDTPPSDSGIDVEETYPGYGYPAFLMDGDPSVWQTTAHIIAPGNQFTLSLFASDFYTDLVGDWSVLGGGQLTVSLYYDNGVTRTTVATTDIMPAASYTEMYGPFELAFTAADVPASIGYAIGVEIVNSSPTAVPNHSWVYFDNVQLAVSPPLITNGSFEEDEAIKPDEDYYHWWFWGSGDGLSSIIEFDEASYIDGTRSLRIEPRGATNWFCIVAYSPFPLEVGALYTTSFWVKAEEPRSLGVKMKPSDNSNDGWGWTDFELTTEWAEYAITSEAMNAEAKFEFHCAGSEVTFWLDFVSVYAGEYIPGVAPGGAVKATEPYPTDGAIDVEREITLSWAPGKSAEMQEVYFGTDINDVNNADITDTTGIYRGSRDLDVTSYIPIEAPLQWGQTYYWRVDGTEPNTLWKGSVWSFTVTNYIVVDDFEDYNDYQPDTVFDTWKDGYLDPLNGSSAGHPDPDFLAGEHYMETTIVHGGEQSMPVFYDNSTSGLSEVTRTFNADWTQDGVITLTLFYKGNLTNDDEPMYVALNGTVITNDNPKAARAGGWTQWDILLQDFVDLGVDLTNVITMSIGFGNKADPVAGGSGYVFIDDIRLSRSLPVEQEPEPEPVDPGTGNLVASYSFENNTQDGSGNGLNGTIMGNPAFVGGIAGMALSFDGVNDYVDLGNNAAFDITEQITLSAWVNTNDAGSGLHKPYVGKGDNAYAIKHASSNTIEFFIFEGTWYVAQVRVDESFNGEWHHVAGTYDGNELKTYVDGILGATVAHVGLIDVQTHNLTISTNSQESGRYYDGAIDEVNIYDRALSKAEIRFLVGN